MLEDKKKKKKITIILKTDARNDRSNDNILSWKYGFRC